MGISFWMAWYLLGFLHLCVIVTSTMYHFCLNANLCAFGWASSSWRILDHIFAWYALAITTIRIFNYERYPFLSDSGVPKFVVINAFSLFVVLVDFLEVLQLIEILYFSSTMVDSVIVQESVILGTLVIGLIVTRIVYYYSRQDIGKQFFLTLHKTRECRCKSCLILYYDGLLCSDSDQDLEYENVNDPKKKLKLGTYKKSKTFCPKYSGPLFLFGCVLVVVAAIMFLLDGYTTYSDVTHGLWHVFGALGGSLWLLSVHYK